MKPTISWSYKASHYGLEVLLLLSGLLLNLVLGACSDSTSTPIVTTTSASTEIKIGVILPLSGPVAALGQDALRGAQLAVAEFNSQIAGKKITLVVKSPDGTGTAATGRAAVRDLVEQSQVDFVIGPFGGDSGLAVRDYAKTHLDKVFIAGADDAQDTTLREPAPNFYRFIPDGVQSMAGLGNYVYQTQGYKRVAILSTDFAGDYSRIAGFMLEFCRAGGIVTKEFWNPLNTSDFSAEFTAIPTDTDAILIDTGGNDGITLFKNYAQSGKQLPLIGTGLSTDPTVLSKVGSLSNILVGVVSSNPFAEENPDPAWQKYLQAYKNKFPDGLPSPSVTAYDFYVGTKAALVALSQINGDLSNNQARFKEALANLKFDGPNGSIQLDSNRQAISINYLRQVDKKPDGTLYNKLIKTIPSVNQTLNLPPDKYLKLGVFGRDNPTCESIRAAGL
jgi:branched-chain amino acid transport system substrate-binding protein